MYEDLFVLACWVVLIDASFLLVYGLGKLACWLYDRVQWIRWFSL